MMQLLSLWKYFLWIQSIRPCFLAGGKKLMWFMFIKKTEKYIINNYRPVSVLPVASKIFEKAIYHNLLNYIEREDLLNINQSRLRIWSHLLKKSLTENFIFYAVYSVFYATDKAINVTKKRKKHVVSSLGNEQYNNNKWSKRGAVVSKNFPNTTFQLLRAACETNTSNLWEEYLRGILKKSSINTKIRRNSSYATNKKWLSRT